MISAKHSYYYALKTASRRVVVEDFNARIVGAAQSVRNNSWQGMVLQSINKEAIDYARIEWSKHYSTETHMGFNDSWETIYNKYEPIPAFFDLAIWQIVPPNRTLQALALGKPSDGKTHLTINWVERYFGPNCLKGGVLLPILACAEEYARLLGCKRVLIKNPVDPAKYERYGFKPYRLPKVYAAYLCKDLGP
jgi:hypothetical protein